MPRTESLVLRVMLTKVYFSLTKEFLLVLNNPSTALDGQYEEIQTITAPRRATKENMLNLKLADLKWSPTLSLPAINSGTRVIIKIKLIIT